MLLFVRAMQEAACITADFAMQNVMMRMGMRVMSMNGMMIKKTKQWIKKCNACFNIIYQMEKEFCPRCGSDFVVKVPPPPPPPPAPPAPPPPLRPP